MRFAGRRSQVAGEGSSCGSGGMGWDKNGPHGLWPSGRRSRSWRDPGGILSSVCTGRPGCARDETKEGGDRPLRWHFRLACCDAGLGDLPRSTRASRTVRCHPMARRNGCVLAPQDAAKPTRAVCPAWPFRIHASAPSFIQAPVRALSPNLVVRIVRSAHPATVSTTQRSSVI